MNSKSWLIGISGTNGAGKDTVSEMISTIFNFQFISVTSILRDEASRRGLTIDRSNTRLISGEWRKKYGPTVLVDRAIEDYLKHKNDFNGLVVSSIRNSSEAIKIHELKGLIIWVDANPRFRYDRIQANLVNRSRIANDKISYQKFLADEKEEMQLSANNTTLDMINVKNQADIIIINEYSRNHLKLELTKFLSQN